MGLDRQRLRRSVPLAIAAALVGALLAGVALVEVTVVDPRITVRWNEDVSPPYRQTLERRYRLQNPTPEEATTWRYELGDRSRENIGALVHDPAVQDTGYIDRDHLTSDSPDIRVRMRKVPLPFPFSTTNEFRDPRALFRLQSGWLLLSGGIILWTARAGTGRRRRNLAVAMLLLVAVTACAFPISPSLVRMGDANQSVGSRGNFEQYAGVHGIRFHAHLTHAILGQLDRLFGRTDAAPLRAQTMLARAATAGFVLAALAIGVLEGWSPFVLRYLALALLAPAALMYFGWREFGYLALNVAAFPVIARGLRDGNFCLEVGSVLCGLGAALHGWGLVGLAGACMAALAAPAGPADRVARALRIIAWGTAAYLGWVAIYIIVLELPVTVGHEAAIPWRPWFAPEVFDSRVNPAIFSAIGARDLSMTAWVVGAPLAVVAASLWRRYGDEVRLALAYALPSAVVMLLVWHTQGLKEDMDVVFGVFPALYALAWVCARDPRRTMVAAALLVSGHLAFWRIVLDPQFVSIAAG